MIGSRSDPDSKFDAEIYSKLLNVNYWKDGQDGLAKSPIIGMHSDGPSISERVQEATDLTVADIDSETAVEDLPMADIYAEFGAVRTFAEINVRPKTTDELNNREPFEQQNEAFPYYAPAEYYDKVTIDHTYTVRTGEPHGIYGDEEARIVDILETGDAD